MSRAGPGRRQKGSLSAWITSGRGILLIVVAVAVVGAAVAGSVIAVRGGVGPAQPVGVGVPSLGQGRFEARAGRSLPALSGRSPITGRGVSLADFRGRPVVINAWASWCVPCRREAPAIERFVVAHPEMTMLGLDVEDNARAARAFYRKFGWTHASIEDPKGKLAAKLGMIGLPTTIFLTRRHREVARIVGATDLSGLDKGLKLAERTRGKRSSS